MLNLGGNFTVSTWIRYKQGQKPSNDRILSRKSAWNDSNGWEIQTSKDKPRGIGARGSSDTSIGTDTFPEDEPINDGEWHFLTVVYNGTTVSIYRNGEFAMSGTIAAVVDNGGKGLVFGCDENGDEKTFKGWMDEVRLGAGSLSADRIRADYLTVADENFFAAHEYKPATILVLR